MINLLFDGAVFKVLTIFSLAAGRRFRRNELKEMTCLNNVLIDNALAKLLKAGVLNAERKIYSANLENENAKQLIAVISRQYKALRELPLDAYFTITDIAAAFSKLKQAELFLFGSYAKLVYKKGSDIDMAVVSGTKIDSATFEKKIIKLEKKYGLKAELHFFDRTLFYKNKKDPLVKEILRNGIKLDC